MTPSRYDELIALLDRHQAAYRVLVHAPEGRTEIVSALRGHRIDHAAKCMIVMVKFGKKTTRYVLAVVPGDSRSTWARSRRSLGGLMRPLPLRMLPRNWPDRSWGRFSLCVR